MIQLPRIIAISFMAIVIMLCNHNFAEAKNKVKFEKWVATFKVEAQQKGISKKLLDKVFLGFKPNPKVISLDNKQPEGTSTFTRYLKSVVNDNRVAKGRKLYKENKILLDEIGGKYGVQPRFIVALWGVETSYGKITGGFNIPHALATLAYDDRRSQFFRDELIKSLKIIEQGNVSFSNMKGSWAGAMGQCQFMPSSFLAYAVDYNGDGRRDIWGTKADVFASIANYLSKSGWDDNLTWGRKVELPKGFDNSLEDRKIFRPLAEWKNLGITKVGGAELPNVNIKAALMFAGKPDEGAYLIYKNYNVLLKWNFSRSFATAVGVLSDKIAY